jgi:DMSO/TMAO reductase YedYZ molybdopterin-dependent catalytic subunit
MLKKFKGVLVALATMIVVFSFASCGDEKPANGKEGTTTTPNPFLSTTAPPTTTTAAPAGWIVEIRGVTGISQLNNMDVTYLPKATIEMVSANELNLSVNNRYTGVTLKSIVQWCGIAAVQSVTVTSLDNYTVVYDPALAMADDTILAWEMDGAAIDSSPPLRMCPKTGAQNMLVKGVSSITIVPQDPALTTTTPLPTTSVTYYPSGYQSSYVYYPPATTSRTSTTSTTTLPTTSTTTTTTTTTTTKTTTTTRSHSYTFPGPGNVTLPGASSTTTATTTSTALTAPTIVPRVN